MVVANAQEDVAVATPLKSTEGFAWATRAGGGRKDLAPADPAEAEAASAARELHEMCARRRKHGTAEVIAFLAALEPDELAAAACTRGNRNGKAAVHFISQMRPDDGAELLEALLARCPDPRAVVNTTTRRGHTPLIYAAGRGHAATVLALLEAGANPRVITVVGDTALKMARGEPDTSGQARRARLAAGALAKLEEAETEGQGQGEEGGAAGGGVMGSDGWLDFRADEQAKAAQAEHVRFCPGCQRKLAATEVETQKRLERERALAAELAALAHAAEHRVREGLRVGESGGAGGDGERERAGSAALVGAALGHTTDQQRAAAGSGVAAALAEALCGAFAAHALRCCREAALQQALRGAGSRDRRPLRLLLAALLQVRGTLLHCHALLF
jgi:hypothetical protein